MDLDHPIFSESVRRIRQWLGPTDLDPVQQEVLERLVHSSGDLAIAADLRFSAEACALGLEALAGLVTRESMIGTGLPRVPA